MSEPLRVLSIHNRYQQRGGEDESREAEEQVLRDHGHHVVAYERSNDEIDRMTRARSAMRTVWSIESARDVARLLRRDRFDVVHVQNFFPLISPSVHRVARRHGAAVVQSLRNYRLLCPAYTFFRDGHVCEDCLHQPIPVSGILHACYRDDRLATAATSAMLAVHRGIGTWRSSVDVFVALTEFAKAKFVEGGLPADRIVVKPNFVVDDPGVGAGEGGYALFVGRLSHEKGITTMLRAWRDHRPPVPLRIVGDGPLAAEVEAAARAGVVEWLGRRPADEALHLMRNAAAVVVPSEWYETFGRVCIEAFACGTPVVASDIGALAELVDDGVTGRRFPPGEAPSLAAALTSVVADPEEHRRMRRAARAAYEARYDAERGYRALVAVYELAVERSTARLASG